MGKMKNLVGLAVVTLSSLGFAMNANAATPRLVNPENLGVDASRKNEEIFLAEGYDLTITSREDGLSGATLSWTEVVDGEEVVKTQNVSDKATIFGAGHNTDETVKSTSITMNGGKVAQIYGGSLHKGHVESAKITINGGTVDFVMGGGAAYWARTNCTWDDSKDVIPATKEDAVTIVDEATVNVNGGTIKNVYGGGEAKSYTKSAVVNIKGGNISLVNGDGSNGFMDKAAINVSAGKIAELQSGNHGELDEIILNITGGEITDLYATTAATGVANDPIGTVKDILIDVREDAKVENLLVGTGAQNYEKIKLYVEHQTVENVDPAFNQEGNEISNYVVVTIDGVEYEVEYNTALFEYDLSKIIVKEGKTFVRFETENGTPFSVLLKLTDNITLKTVFIDNVATEEVLKELTDLKNQNNSLANAIANMKDTTDSLKAYVDSLNKTIENLSKELDAVKNETTDNKDTTIDKNPNTVDAVMSYAALTLFSLSGLGITTKKVFTK